MTPYRQGSCQDCKTKDFQIEELQRQLDQKSIRLLESKTANSLLKQKLIARKINSDSLDPAEGTAMFFVAMFAVTILVYYWIIA